MPNNQMTPQEDNVERDMRTEKVKNKENKCYADKYIFLRAKLFDALNIHNDIGDEKLEEITLNLIQENVEYFEEVK